MEILKRDLRLRPALARTQAVGGKERAATDGETDPLNAQIHDKVREAAQAWEAAEGAAERESQAAQLRRVLTRQVFQVGRFAVRIAHLAYNRFGE